MQSAGWVGTAEGEGIGEGGRGQRGVERGELGGRKTDEVCN